jgi:hypothetical protein
LFKALIINAHRELGPMSEKKTNDSQENNNDSKDEKIHLLSKSINTLSSELEIVKKSVQKRRNENRTLKVLFYTGIFVLLAGILYSNSVLQRAHMRSLEKNFFSVEQRLYQDINQTKINLELKVQRLQKKIKHIDGTDIFTILSHMDFAISQIHPTQEKTIMLINQVRLNTDELSRLLREEVSSHKTIDKNEVIEP